MKAVFVMVLMVLASVTNKASATVDGRIKSVNWPQSGTVLKPMAVPNWWKICSKNRNTYREVIAPTELGERKWA